MRKNLSKTHLSAMLMTITTVLAPALSGDAPVCRAAGMTPEAYTASTATAASTPCLFNVSEVAQPGDAITIHGAYLGTSPQVWAQEINAQGQPVASSLRSLVVLNSSANVIQAQMPSDLPFGLFQICVQTAGATSGLKLVNQARGVCFDIPQVAPGGTFRVFGRNLSVPGSQSTVLFVDAAGNSLPAGVRGADAYSLNVVAPTRLVPGGAYKVYVSNGLGGSQGATLVPAPLQIRTAGVDPLHLNVPWAADLTFLGNVYNVKTDTRLSLHAVGNGVADDRPAIQAAIQAASNCPKGGQPGGVVYLPAGKYYLDTSSTALAIKSHVVLTGDGKGRTVIQYGNNANAASYGMGFASGSLSGIFNLTVQNLNPNPTPNGNLFAAYNGTTSRIFLEKVEYLLGRGGWLQLPNVDQLLIGECSIQGQNAPKGCLWLNGDSHLAFRNNTVSYHSGRIYVREVQGGIVEGNTFSRDGACDLPRIVENGGLEVSFSQDLILTKNTILVQNQPDTLHNDGESILTQNALYPDFRDAGTVTASDSQSVSDTGKDWSKVQTFVPRSIVAIISGPALGQWRTIVGHTPNGLSVDRPWDVTPPVGSRYAITSWSANQLFFLGNTLQNNAKGIQLYEGAWDSVVAGNTLTDSGGITLRAIDRTNDVNSPAYNNPCYPRETRFDPAWNNLIAGNTVSCPTALQYAHVTAAFYQIWGPVHGTGILNTEITNNTVIGALHAQRFFSEMGGVSADGYWTVADNQTNLGGALLPVQDVTGFVGTGLNGNQAEALAGGPYHLLAGSSQTSIAAPGVPGAFSAN